MDAGRSTPHRPGRYELIGTLGVGGTATVLLARDVELDRRVALKLLHEHLRHIPEVAREFLGEARLCAQIFHSNIVRILDVGVEPFGLFLVMELVEGTTLSALLRARGLSTEPIGPTLALAILRDALAGLHHAHELRDAEGKHLGLVHRDFTPQNILVGLDGVTRLTDFGIARALSRQSFTQDGFIKGKSGYMAPEQILGGTVDRRCDVWAAGALAWELFAGRPLFQGDELQNLMLVATCTAEPLRSVREQIPAAVESVVARALDRDPDRRWETARDFSEALAEAWSPEVIAAPEPALARRVFEVTQGALPVQPLTVTLPWDANAHATLQHAATTQASPRNPSRSRRWRLGVAAVLGVAVLCAEIWERQTHSTPPAATAIKPEALATPVVVPPARESSPKVESLPVQPTPRPKPRSRARPKLVTEHPRAAASTSSMAPPQTPGPAPLTPNPYLQPPPGG